MTVSTLQATRRKQGKQAGDEENLVVPVQRRKGTFADIAEARPSLACATRCPVLPAELQVPACSRKQAGSPAG